VKPPTKFPISAPVALDDGALASQTSAGSGRSARGGFVALLLILSASFVVVLDFSIVNVALPSIQRDLGFSSGDIQWVVTAYAITFGGLLIAGGRAADLFGRRRTFVIGLSCLSAAARASPRRS
jgi:MFS family permease